MKLPLDYIELYESNGAGTTGTAVDVQACLDAAYNTYPNFLGIAYNSASGRCTYYTRLVSPRVRWWNSTVSTWLRVDLHMHLSAVTSCLTEQDTGYLVMQMVFDGRQ